MLKIKITVPQEYVGTAIGRINAFDGVVTSMELKEPLMLISASLPEFQFGHLVDDISRSTRGQGKTERNDA